MNKEKNRKGKKILFVVLIILVVIACGYLVVIRNAQNNAKHTIENSLLALKTGNNMEEEIYKFTGNNNKETTDIVANQEFGDIFFKDLNYEIIGTKGNLKEVTISLKISNKNAAKIFGKYLEEIFKFSMASSFSGENLTQEELDKKMNAYLKDTIKTDDVEFITNNVEIKMEKNEEKWVVKEESQQNMINTMLPGLKELAENMQNNQE